MELKIARKPASPAPVRYGAESTQVYRWPAFAYRLNLAIVVGFGALSLLSFYGIHRGVVNSDLTKVVAGILGTFVCAMVFLAQGLIHLIAAREIRFTRDCLIIKQTGRRPLVLPYYQYHDEWVADLTNQDLIRIVTFSRNRGCTVLFPPAWLQTAMIEIARIQQEEGWYQPEFPALAPAAHC